MRRLPVLALSLLLTVAACDRPDPAESPERATARPDGAHDARVAGTVTYRERVALPEDALVVVALREQGDATRTLARTTVPAGGRQVPIPFELDASGLEARQTLVLDARIEAGGRAMWVTREPLSVAHAAERDAVEVVLARLDAVEPVAPEPLEEARGAGVTFRAVGQEPGWILDIHGDATAPERIVYRTNYATEEFVFRTVAREATADAVTFRADGLEVVVRDRFCRDVMSGEPFVATVSIRHASGDVEGCGRPID